ncbi:MAG: branched-chain amino acid ABC transporter permease [Anaerolineales bacterium]|nr:branched-chain amino acid ABC transporter permease [Anaerolineales bacterium]
MLKNKTTLGFLSVAIFVILLVHVLVDQGILNSFWYTILRIGAVMTIVSLGLNLIYGINGQFSLGQWGFYAIGAYAAADVTYRWSQLHSASGLVILLLVLLFVGGFYLIIGRVLSKIRGLDSLSAFAIYLAGTILAAILAIALGKILIDPVTAMLTYLPANIAMQLVFLLAILLAGILAAEVSYLLGLPVLTLGSDYFGIATLGFTIIVKVLLDNSDTLLGFAEMKGARGMVGIPKLSSWLWVASFVLIIVVLTRNLLQSSHGRAIISVREDEIAAKAMGIDIASQKTITFVIGSLFAGLAGGLYAHVNGFLHPNTFNFIKSFDPMIIIVFGGLGSITGTVVASFTWALVLEGFLRLFLPEGFETWRFVVYPLLLLIMMLLRPQGLFGTYEFPFLQQILPPALKLKANNMHTTEAETASSNSNESTSSTGGAS